ncbi:DNA polymerase III subunit chi [Xanthobacter tagetidis]|uniref:DNA polymerase III subunit chi n=1 Tax=Xanthobacter tagetidis TaxID=60216 RepID=A0A3L7AFM1_9HYPH|nr:DNA polymerase III subunit chi [Xanthobacter tagetidis]MBB6306635.1 DNA polymerase-3 subunit chi [Xanthobacter tagetidis]RLP79047.1 DNA polymerase III subunit chi [Xanthobacter tagetidis]
MTDILFYHLERRPLEAVLPALLEKSLERSWRCVVECGSAERRDALDAHLWTYSEASFLPHGTDAQPQPERQPVLIATSDANPNGATVRFLVDGVALPDPAPYERLVYLFDGRDDEQVAAARERWKEAKALGAALTYWQQDENGRWVRKA